MSRPSISVLSEEPIFVRVRKRHPLTGPADPSEGAATVECAFTVANPTPEDWRAATFLDGTVTWEGKVWYVVQCDIDPDNALPLGEMYTWVKYSTGEVIRGGVIHVY
jgi:hypothetical protein